MDNLLDAVISAKLAGNLRGPAVVTPAGLVTATGQMTTEQAAQTRENIGVVIDPTLTIDGAAADAKATGDAVGELKSHLRASDDNIKVPLAHDFRLGGIDNSTGYKKSNTNRAHTVFYRLQNGARYTCKSGYEFVAYAYDLSGTTANYSGVKINAYTTEYLATDNATVAFVVRKTDNTAITDIADIEMYISYELTFEIDGYVQNLIAENISGAVVANTVLVGDTGNVTTNSNYSTTDYVAVDTGDVLLISATCGGTIVSNTYTGLYGYDRQGVLVGCLVNLNTSYNWKNYGSYISDSVAIYSNYRYIVPNGVAFVRLSSRTTGTDSQLPKVRRVNPVNSAIVKQVGNIDCASEFKQGSLNNSGEEVTATNRIVSPFYDIDGKNISITQNGQKIAYCLYDETKTFLLNSGWKYSDFTLIQIANAKYVRFVVAKMDDTTIVSSELEVVIKIADGLEGKAEQAENSINGFIYTPYTGNVEMIMHRGYNSLAPENTIPAFKLARRMGFSTIETDVQLTSDGVPVILHDETINRTSNGTGNVYDKTLEELKALDFGSWKSTMWANTKIPTFEEMLDCCKKVGLNVYIEIKQESPWTQALITSCVELVRKYGMKDHVTWISFSNTILGYVKTADETAKLGYLMTTYTTDAVDTCVSLRTGKNEVMAVTRYDLLSSSVLNYLISQNVPLTAYLFDKNTDAEAMQPYVTGALTNEFNAMKYLYNQNMIQME